MNTRETVLSFAVADDEELILTDRTTLENYATCPAMARLIQTKAVLNESLIAESGSAVHYALSEAVQLYIDEPDIPIGALAEAAQVALRSSRPDIQPAALAAGRPAVWSWARFISQHSANNILRFDGGRADRSGQLAHDLPTGNDTLRITGEVDLLMATPAKQVLRLVDYKSGWKRFGTDSIAASFQFGVYVWLIFANYPDVEAVEVQVWLTRTNTLTYPVTFERARLKEIETRIRSAAGEFVRYRRKDPNDVPTWPAADKCGFCPAATICTAAKHIQDFALDPSAYVESMVALQSKLDAMEKVASAWVERTGTDIVSPSGACFGVNKPKANRKPTKALYSVKVEQEETESD